MLCGVQRTCAGLVQAWRGDRTCLGPRTWVQLSVHLRVARPCGGDHLPKLDLEGVVQVGLESDLGWAVGTEPQI